MISAFRLKGAVKNCDEEQIVLLADSSTNANDLFQEIRNRFGIPSEHFISVWTVPDKKGMNLTKSQRIHPQKGPLFYSFEKALRDTVITFVESGKPFFYLFPKRPSAQEAQAFLARFRYNGALNDISVEETENCVFHVILTHQYFRMPFKLNKTLLKVTFCVGATFSDARGWFSENFHCSAHRVQFLWQKKSGEYHSSM
jgi:hypothetical protein